MRRATTVCLAVLAGLATLAALEAGCPLSSLQFPLGDTFSVSLYGCRQDYASDGTQLECTGDAAVKLTDFALTWPGNMVCLGQSSFGWASDPGTRPAQPYKISIFHGTDLGTDTQRSDSVSLTFYDPGDMTIPSIADDGAVFAQLIHWGWAEGVAILGATNFPEVWKHGFIDLKRSNGRVSGSFDFTLGSSDGMHLLNLDSASGSSDFLLGSLRVVGEINLPDDFSNAPYGSLEAGCPF